MGVAVAQDSGHLLPDTGTEGKGNGGREDEAPALNLDTPEDVDLQEAEGLGAPAKTAEEEPEEAPGDEPDAGEEQAPENLADAVDVQFLDITQDWNLVAFPLPFADEASLRQFLENQAKAAQPAVDAEENPDIERIYAETEDIIEAEKQGRLEAREKGLEPMELLASFLQPELADPEAEKQRWQYEQNMFLDGVAPEPEAEGTEREAKGLLGKTVEAAGLAAGAVVAAAVIGSKEAAAQKQSVPERPADAPVKATRGASFNNDATNSLQTQLSRIQEQDVKNRYLGRALAAATVTAAAARGAAADSNDAAPGKTGRDMADDLAQEAVESFADNDSNELSWDVVSFLQNALDTTQPPLALNEQQPQPPDLEQQQTMPQPEPPQQVQPAMNPFRNGPG